VDYKEVCDLLQTKGIDLEHNRFLILQGEVEQISLMKPKALNPNDTGLLEYLEEIIGSCVHVEEIEKL
jgi:structural maintenance of chromosome 4